MRLDPIVRRIYKRGMNIEDLGRALGYNDPNDFIEALVMNKITLEQARTLILVLDIKEHELDYFFK